MAIKNTFFFHVCSEAAISNGWDYENSPADFMLAQDDKVLSGMVYSVGGFELREIDIAMAAKGQATDDFKEFWDNYAENIMYADAKDDGVVLQSMHSGSSDLLFVKDVRSMVAGWK